jgi:hypothetical protein
MDKYHNGTCPLFGKLRSAGSPWSVFFANYS